MANTTEQDKIIDFLWTLVERTAYSDEWSGEYDNDEEWKNRYEDEPIPAALALSTTSITGTTVQTCCVGLYCPGDWKDYVDVIVTGKDETIRYESPGTSDDGFDYDWTYTPEA